MDENKTLMNRNVELTIGSYYPSLTKSEKRVADFVLKKSEDLLYISITDLAEEAGVGEATVLRFCRKIGMKGYQDFKLTLAKGLAEQESKVGKSENSSLEFVDTLCDNTINAVRSMSLLVDRDKLKQAIDKIYHANSIYFFGVGTSGLTALDAKNRFIRIGKKIDAITDPHIQSMAAATLSKDDLVIGISNSGSTRDTIDSLEVARDNGAFIIAITYYLRSPITKLADIVLPGGEKESPLEGGSLLAKIAQLYVIDLLCTGLALKNKDYSLRMKEQTADAVVNKII